MAVVATPRRQWRLRWGAARSRAGSPLQPRFMVLPACPCPAWPLPACPPQADGDGGAWHFVENGGFVSRIYTTQDHLGPNDIFPTYTGDSTGKWEGQTLVVDTIGLRDDTWLGPGALIHSDQTRLTERIRQTGANALELDLTVDDPVAFTRPWHVVQRYRRLPKGGFTHDWACKVVRNAKG